MISADGNPELSTTQLFHLFILIEKPDDARLWRSFNGAAFVKFEMRDPDGTRPKPLPLEEKVV